MSSSYYYSLYKKADAKVKSYQGNIRELKSIQSNASAKLADEIIHVNKAISLEKTVHQEAVRHNRYFYSLNDSMEEMTQASVNSDADLSVVLSELAEEIERLNLKREQAIAERDDYYRQYEREKERERQERERKNHEHSKSVAKVVKL